MYQIYSITCCISKRLLGAKLYHHLSALGVPVTFEAFGKEQRLGHDGIFKSQELVTIFDLFVNLS